jgi:hypothetical protein
MAHRPPLSSAPSPQNIVFVLLAWLLWLQRVEVLKHVEEMVVEHRKILLPPLFFSREGGNVSEIYQECVLDRMGRGNDGEDISSSFSLGALESLMNEAPVTASGYLLYSSYSRV